MKKSRVNRRARAAADAAGPIVAKQLWPGGPAAEFAGDGAGLLDDGPGVGGIESGARGVEGKRELKSRALYGMWAAREARGTARTGWGTSIKECQWVNY